MSPLQRYFLVRLSLVPITLFFIFLINFLIITTIPGGPVAQIIAQTTFGNLGGGLRENFVQIGEGNDAGIQVDNPGDEGTRAPTDRSNLAEAQLDLIKQRYGLDQPLHIMFALTRWADVRFDFGNSS